ncbi:hypothetical protein DUI87_03449 [Hirundo rustica rustica]|uniref:ribonuclease H n=1 Tax=Hirundo rustica rustica TaxID=333673 RepID=A0A3M0L3Q3_HIRRU|nr:hypothetical protein DUI87_03449 [Hirundo rustica rustica]
MAPRDDTKCQAILSRFSHNLGAPRHREIIYENTYVMEQRRFSEGYQQVSGRDKENASVADTGSDITIVAHSKWPQGWELVPVYGVISGIGGATTSMWSKRAILIEGPDGQIATGLKCLPAICQMYVGVLSLIREKFPDAIIFHYMDDILICTETDYYLETVLEKTIQAIEGAVFEIATEKIQHTCLWTYLGFRIDKRTIAPQQLTIKDNPRTLRDLQQLCGSINWVRNLIGITTEDLGPLFNLLRGSDDLDSPPTITPEAREVIRKVEGDKDDLEILICWIDSTMANVVLASRSSIIQFRHHTRRECESSDSWGTDAPASPDSSSKHRQKIEAGEQGDKSVTQAAANPTATQVVAKPDSEAKTLAVAAVKKGKKHMHKTDRPVDDDSGEATMLDGTEARHLGSLSHDPVIDQEMMREASPCSLWERVLGSVAQRYLCADNLYMQQTQWKTIEQGIQRLREMAVVEIVFSDDLNTRNPNLVPCTPVMW